jgi:outer membrane lipoprotein SlyB
LLILPAFMDNAAMSKPFQFSMRRMFGAVSLACVGAFLFAIAIRRGTDETLALAIVCVSGAVVGGGVGQLFHRPVIGTVIGVPLALGLWFFLPEPLG